MSLFKSTKHAEICPECGAALHIKRGKQGLFLGCSAYPACDYLKPLHQASHVIKTLDETCPECGHSLQLKQGLFGIFIGCSYYPECHFTVHDELETQVEIDCPECKAHKLVARKGRSGKTFYGCAGFPACKFTVAGQPVQKTCPQCHYPVVTRKTQRSKAMFLCANKYCQHLFSEEHE